MPAYTSLQAAPGRVLPPASVRAVFNRLRRFMTFVESRRGQFRLDLLDQTDLDAWLASFAWAVSVGPSRSRPCSTSRPICTCTADRLSQSGFTFTPWRGRPVSQVAGCPPVSRENSTPRIPEPVDRRHAALGRFATLTISRRTSSPPEPSSIGLRPMLT